MQPRHVVLRADGVLRCVVPAYLQRSALHGDLHDRWLGPLATAAGRVGLRLRPSLAVTLPLSTVSDPLGDPSTLPEGALDAVFDALEETARAEGARAVVWAFLDSRHAPLVRAGVRRGYVFAFAGSRAILDLPGCLFEEYLASLPKRVRHDLRQDVSRARAIGAECVVTSDFADRSGEMAALYGEFFLRRNGHAPALDPGFFARVARIGAGAVSAQLTTAGGRLVTMSLNMLAARHLDCGFAACAPGHAGGAAHRASLVFHRVRAAFAAGARTVDLGPASLYPKVLRGARLEPRFTLARGLSRSSHAALRPLAALVGRRNAAKELRALAGLAGRESVSAALRAAQGDGAP